MNLQELTAPRHVFVVVHALGGGGITHAALDQCNMFASAGYRVTLITLTDSVARRTERLRATGRLTADIEVRNPHEDLRESWKGVEPGEQPTGLEELLAREDLFVENRGKAPGIERYFAPDGTYVAHIRRNEDGGVVSVGWHVDRDARVREHWGLGHVHHLQHLSVNGVVDSEAWYAPNGRPYLSRVAGPTTGRGQGLAVQAPGAEPDRFKGLPEWHVAWLREVFAEAGEGAVAVANTASTVTKLAQVGDTEVRLFGMLHHNQFDAPYTVGSQLRKDDERVFKVLDGLDGLIVLTEPQRRDMCDIVGDAVPVYAVPNTTRIPDLDGEPTKDPRLVSVFARLVPQKALHEAIHAFATIVAEVPDARLEIYGGGESKQELLDLVVRLGLQDSVLFPGRTPHPHNVMARSVCTVSTSNWEAMPLAIMESQASGTPVVAYDCLYGPATLIEDGVTGHLVDRGDREAFAEAVIGLLKDPDRAARMGHTARERIAERYNSQAVLRQWENVFTSA